MVFGERIAVGTLDNCSLRNQLERFRESFECFAIRSGDLGMANDEVNHWLIWHTSCPPSEAEGDGLPEGYRCGFLGNLRMTQRCIACRRLGLRVAACLALNADSGVKHFTLWSAFLRRAPANDDESRAECCDGFHDGA